VKERRHVGFVAVLSDGTYGGFRKTPPASGNFVSVYADADAEPIRQHAWCCVPACEERAVVWSQVSFCREHGPKVGGDV
jgi:hypothetical protein